MSLSVHGQCLHVGGEEVSITSPLNPGMVWV